MMRLRDPPSGRPLAIRSADGTMLHAEVFGPEDGTTLVLAHGWTEMLDFWTYVIRDLTGKGFRAVAYDLRGHGESDPAADGDYAIERFGEDLEAVLKGCVLRAAERAVAGHSLGAMSIAAWAEHHDVARRVFAVAMINTGVGDLIAESLLFPLPGFAKTVNKALAVHGFLGARAPLPHASTPASHAAIRYIAFGPEATPAQIAFYERMLIGTPPDARASIGIAMSELELHHALEHITVPTLVIGGENDRLTPPVACAQDRRHASQPRRPDRPARHRPHGAARAPRRGKPRDRKARRTIRGRGRDRCAENADRPVQLMHIDPYIVLGSAIVGLLVGMTGAGGGALMTPMLILLFGVKPSAAISSDLVAAVVMRPIGAGVHLRAGTVNLRLVRWLVLGSVPAAFLGAYLLRLMGDSKSAQHNIEVALGAALLIGAGAMALRFVLDRRGGHTRTAVAADIAAAAGVDWSRWGSSAGSSSA